MKTKFTGKYILFLFAVCLLGAFLLNRFAFRTGTFRVSITVPSEENGPVTPGRSFFIGGTIDGDRPLPDDAAFRVSVFDEAGEEVRFAENTRKDCETVDRFCDAFFYYADDIDPERSDVSAQYFPCLIVRNGEEPGASLRDANIKCWFSDEAFSSFIPGATDEAHGLLIDDGIGYTDGEGNPYDALPDGRYTAVASLTNGRGKVLARAEKEFSIAPAKEAILCRFHPDEHYERMMKFAADHDLSMAIDYLPGYYKDRNGSDRGGLRAMFMGNDAALYNSSHVTMVEYLASPDSSSLTFELPFLERYFNIDDPEKFTVCRYDIGEPAIRAGDRDLQGKLVQVENGDRLCLCRADLTEGAREGALDFNSLPILGTDTDFSDGVTFAGRESGAAAEGQIAVAGLAVPYQLKDEEILFDPARNETGLLNRVGDIVYTVWDGKRPRNTGNRSRSPAHLRTALSTTPYSSSIMCSGGRRSIPPPTAWSPCTAST